MTNKKVDKQQESQLSSSGYQLESDLEEKMRGLLKKTDKKQIVALTGMSSSGAGKMINESSVPRVNNLIKLCRGLGINFGWFADEAEMWAKHKVTAHKISEEAASYKKSQEPQDFTSRRGIHERMIWARDTVLDVMHEANADVSPRVSEVLSMMLYQGTITEEGLIHLMDAFARDLK